MDFMFAIRDRENENFQFKQFQFLRKKEKYIKKIKIPFQMRVSLYLLENLMWKHIFTL